jgi:Lecithin retinol acyltransferase
MAKGDHICVARYGGIIYHHGIDMGDGSAVHFRKDSLGNKTIVDRTSIEDFAKGGTIKVIQHQSSDPPDVVVLRAKDCHRLQTEGALKSYDLLELNCEHLATWCKTGEIRSKQVEDVYKSAQMAAQTTSEDDIWKLVEASFCLTLADLALMFSLFNLTLFNSH